MNSYICKKIGEKEENYLTTHLSNDIFFNVDYNDQLFKEGFKDETNKLIILCILSKIVYNYKQEVYINQIIKYWNIKYTIEEINNVVYGLFYNDEYLVISFKGTSSYKDMLSNIDLVQEEDQYSIPGKFHKGFHDLILTNNVAEILEKKINEIISCGSQKNVYVTGHSLGGALATVFYSYLENSPLSIEGRLNKDIDIELVSYGCPRTGDYDFSKSLKKCTRVVNGNDIITMVPIFYYKHYEKLYHIGSNFSFRFVSDHSLNKYYNELIKNKK